MAADPRFHGRPEPKRLAEIAAAAGGTFQGDGERLFRGVAPLQSAEAEEVSFLDNRRYAAALAGEEVHA